MNEKEIVKLKEITEKGITSFEKIINYLNMDNVNDNNIKKDLKENK